MLALTIGRGLIHSQMVAPEKHLVETLLGLSELDDEPDSGFGQLEENQLIDHAITAAVCEPAGIYMPELVIRPPVFMMIGLLSGGKHERILLWLTVLKALSEEHSTITMELMFRTFHLGFPSEASWNHAWASQKNLRGESQLQYKGSWT